MLIMPGVPSSSTKFDNSAKRVLRNPLTTTFLRRMSTAESSGYTKLSDADEKLFALDPFFLSPIAMFLATVIIGMLIKHRKGNNKNSYYLLAINCAITSAICSIFCCIIKTFFCNNLFISWNYPSMTTNGSHFITITDSFSNVIYFCGKVLFYYGFTFQIESVIYNDKHNVNSILNILQNM